MSLAEKESIRKLLAETDPFKERETYFTDFQRLDRISSNADKYDDIKVPCLALRNVLLDYMDLWRTVRTYHCPEMEGD